MIFDILTIFPDAFRSYFDVSIMARAQAKKYIAINLHDLRDWTTDPHRTVDDRPYGGGAGMVMRPDIVARAMQSLKRSDGGKRKTKRRTRTLLFSPQGRVFTQADAVRLSRYDRLIMLAGRYEGYDERIRAMVDEEVSLGDFVLSGGELPAMAVIDAVSRMIPGVLGKSSSLDWESFSKIDRHAAQQFVPAAVELPEHPLLEYPQYTRPKSLKVGKKTLRVPKVLLSGNHAEILAWRLKEAERRTRRRRPDLLKQ